MVSMVSVCLQGWLCGLHIRVVEEALGLTTKSSQEDQMMKKTTGRSGRATGEDCMCTNNIPTDDWTSA